MSLYSLSETKRLLFQSCEDGSATTVQQLLTQHSDLRDQINSLTDDYRNSALIIASENGHTGIVKLLLQCGADVDHRNSRGCTALMKTSENGDSNLEIVDLLLKHGAQVDLQNDGGYTALMLAAINNQAELAAKLVQEYGASISLTQRYFSWTALMEASEIGCIDIVKLLLEHSTDDLGWSLALAIINHHSDITELLLKYGAQINDDNWSDVLLDPPLVIAVGQGDVDVVKLLLKHGAKDLADDDGNSALMIASENGHTDIVKLLLQCGADVDHKNSCGYTALMNTSENGDSNLEIVDLLLQHGAQVDLQNNGGSTALRLAAINNQAKLAAKLVQEYGASVSLTQRYYSWTALMEASDNGYIDIVKLFLEHSTDGLGWSLALAIINHHSDITELLLKYGAQVNDDNWSDILVDPPLVIAVERGDVGVVKLLLKHGAKNGLDLAVEKAIANKYAKIIRVLSEYGAHVDESILDSIDDSADATDIESDLYEEAQHLNAIESAIKETGTLDHTIIHGVFVGPPRSGKDSLMKRLLGEVAPNTSPSTGVLENAVHVKVEESCTYAATIGQSKWTRLQYDDEALHLMRAASNNSSTRFQFRRESTTESDIEGVISPSVNVVDNPRHAIGNRTNKDMQTLDSHDQLEIFPQPLDFQHSQIPRIPRKTKCKTPMKIFKEAIRNKGLEGLKKQLTNTWSLYLTNTGGQMEFQELLPLLVSGPSMFFVTFQLHKDLNECFQVQYELPSGKSSKCYQSSLSILDSILQTLSTIAAMGTFVYKGLQKKCIPLKPKVFLIGTHKDLLNKKSAATVIDRIDAQLQTVIKSTSHYREGIIQFASESRMIFTVSNLDPSDSDFQAIRSAVEKTVEKGDYKMRSPTHWMIYSLVVRQLQNQVESYDECFAIAKECGIKDENEFNETLHFIHTKMGLVRYFPHQELKDVVIVDPQILFEKVTELIVETFTFENLCDHSKLEAFKRMGIFDLSDFTKISSRTGQKLTPTLFATMLEYLRIAARFQQSGETKYFLPCVLTHAQVKQNVYNSTIPQLIATFQCGYCPRGLFGTLITYLINNEMQSDFEWELNTDNIYRDEVCFQVGPYDTVTIRFMPTHLQISCAESNPDLPRINCAQEDVCQEVRESVEKGIKTVTSAINYIKAQHSFTFYCTSDVCSEDPHPSKLKEFKGKLCSLKCEKLKKCFPLPSGYEKWQLCSTMIKECHSLKERLDESFLIQQLSDCAAKWREIGTHLKFQQKKLDIIQAKPYLQSDAPRSWLSALISEWMERAPGGSANLEDLKSAVSKAGFGVVAAELSPQLEIIAGESRQFTDTGRKRTSSSTTESSSKRPRAGESGQSTDTGRKRTSSSAAESSSKRPRAGESGQSTDTRRKRTSSSAAEGSSKRPQLS